MPEPQSKENPAGPEAGEYVARILFVEAQDWEIERITDQCERHCLVHSRSQLLRQVPEHDIPDGVNVLCPFIHSRVDGEQMDRLPSLELIATRSTGFDHIDVAECKRRGITVCNVPEYGENTVAEHTFAILLALTRKIHRTYERVSRGDFSIQGLRGIDLHGRTFGCLGTGRIAERVLRIAKGFGMHLLAYDINPRDELAREIGFEYVDFETLLRRANVLSVHVPYNDRTRHIIDAEAIAKLPRGAIVVNTARGGLIDPQALVDALRDGHLGGAALDVLEAERAINEEAELLSPSYDTETLRNVVRNHALVRMPNVIITPHVAFNSEEAVLRIIQTTLENIHAYFRGEPRNVIVAGKK